MRFYLCIFLVNYYKPQNKMFCKSGTFCFAAYNISGNYAKIARQCVLKSIGDRFYKSDIDVSKILE